MSWQELLAAAEDIRAAAAARDPSLADLRLAGIGWATVDAERAQRELDARLDDGGDEASPGAPPAAVRASWAPFGRDAALGARGWIRAAAWATPAAPALVVLEPDTEGRLAASLARWDEGVLVVYLGAGAGAGAVGPGRLARTGSRWGPHVVIMGERE